MFHSSCICIQFANNFIGLSVITAKCSTREKIAKYSFAVFPGGVLRQDAADCIREPRSGLVS